MLKKLISFIVLLLSVSSVLADTGTYVIDKQDITLTIFKNGDVNIFYDFGIECTGGNIPWVCLGTPNKNYDIIGRLRGLGSLDCRLTVNLIPMGLK